MRIQLALSLSVFTLQFAFLGLPAKAQTPTTVAGSTPGQFSVSESGAATYRIPIQVPPGVAGMQPKLELVYNSQSGNGLLGMGWSLSGLSAITRCPRTMASDGVRGGVNLDANDRFCLDGQRLMLVAGSYGADGSEYRTERESFSKIMAYGAVGTGPQYFVVKTKAGLTMEYGNTEDSRALNQPGSVVRAWALNKITDVKANILTVSYFKSSDNSVQVPISINYGGNAVSFEYDVTRPDKSQGYVAGSLVQVDRRITNFKTYSAGTILKDYQIVYEVSAATNRSRLQGLTECDAIGNCLSPVNLGWGNSITAGFPAGYSWGVPAGYGNGYAAQLGDFNGDGKTDIYLFRSSDGSHAVWLNQGDGTFAAGYSWGVPAGYGNGYATQLGDFNGDGKIDIYLFRSSDGSHAVWLNLGLVPDLLSQVANTKNAVTSITFKSLTDPSAYTKDSSPNAAVYPKVDLQYPLYVVSRVEQSNGVGGVVATEYKYGGLKAELGTGRGLLGFRWMSAKNLATGIESYTEYRQDYPYTGIPLKNETRLAGAGNGGVLKRSTTTVACQIPQTAAACVVAAGNRYFPYVAQSVEESWDLGGLPYPSITSSYVYGQSPQYGDPTQITVGTSDGASKTTVNEYWPADTANWILGRLKKATVTSSKP